MRTRWFGDHIEQRCFALLVRAYPPAFRAEYGAEMNRDFGMLRSDAARGGAGARLALWQRLVRDTARSAPRERWVAWRERSRGQAARGVPQPDWAGAFVAGLAVFLLYWATLAPTTAFWDAGEYITVASVLGIPHPPGNPLFVFLARAWDALLGGTGWPTAVRINALSALMSAAAHALLFVMLERSLRGADWSRSARRVAAACGVVLSATAFTVWHQSNVNEKVYTVSFFTVLLCAWLVVRWRDTRRPALLLLAFYVAILTMANHMMGALVAPALLVFVWLVDRRLLVSRRMLAAMMPLLVIALSAHFFLPLRAAQQPLVNEGDPQCSSAAGAAASVFTLGRTGCAPLSGTLRREQYQKPSIMRDPAQPEQPRSARLLAHQFINYAQYFDWQWARSVAPRNTLFGWPRPLMTLGMIVLIILGARAQWRVDPRAATLHAVLLLTLSAGLVLYLNFKWGYTIAGDAVPDRAMHEVRERDYFFLIGFSLWGAWAGVGLAVLWRRIGATLSRWTRRPHLAAAPVLGLALIPLALNWSWAGRAHDWTARDWAYNVLMSVEPYGVLITNGDNDSFPLWYLQQVERIREDVTIVLSPYLGTGWYARQVRDVSRPCAPGQDAGNAPTSITCQRTFRADRVHPLLLAAWGPRAQQPPKDSILPLNDAELDRIAETFFVAEEPIDYRAGSLEATIPAGTLVTPVDTFVAAILRHTYGQRPIHFMSPSPVATRLGLLPHTVRVGLTWRLRTPDETAGIVAIPEEEIRGATGSSIDVALTDTLTEHIFIVRGRLLDATKSWVDHATFDIPMQYSLMHYTAARAHELMHDSSGVDRHVDRMQFWNRFAAD